jgi:adenosine deaminase
MTALAELHVHLEGTAPPELIRRLADRNGVSVPEGVFASPERFAWVDFLDFLLVSCAREGAIYVELLVSPDHAAEVGLPAAEQHAGVAQGIDDARAETGIEARMLLVAVRNFGVEAAVAIARSHAEERHPYIVGFNLAGDEAGYPPGQFAEAYAIAAASGLGCTVHAGEHAGAESVREALTLPVTRLSHGVRAVEDPALVKEIAARGIVLEACPTSNVATGVFPSYEVHPLRRLYEAGVKVTLGSDDPPYFGASIGGEYAVARERLGFEEGELETITRTAIEASFADDALKRSLINRMTAKDGRANL